MSDALNNLRGKVLRRTAERVGLVPFLARADALLGQPEVSDLKVALGVKQDIFGL